MILQRLLGDVPAGEFLERHFLKLPFTRAGGCHDLTPLGTRAMVEGLMASPGADVLVGRAGEPGRTPDRALPELLEQGYTVGVRHAERHHPELAALAEGFRDDFAAPVDVHVYCTPAQQPGFGWHYDAEDVFLLQLAGGKEWGLRKNTVNPWPLVETMPADLRYEREVMPLLRCTLHAGDWLYIPAGYWHRGEAGEQSISLSVGLASATALDAFDFLRRRLLPSLRWRQRLPTPGRASPRGEGELVGEHQALFAELGQELAALLADPEFARAFLADRRTRS